MSLRDFFLGGDLRSIGRADEVARMLATDCGFVATAVALIGDPDPVVRMRSADALEKASRADHTLLGPHKAELLRAASVIRQQEVEWHLLQMLPRLELLPAERSAVFDLAERALARESRIVQAEALSALFALAETEPALVERARQWAEISLASGAPAVRARARRLLKKL